jgi:dTDP-4-amino-4,6-dideoxygalactose transaminase
MNGHFIRFHRPSIGEEEINEVVETLRSGWLTTGPRAARFEREFRERTGATHAVAVNSATAGLHLALAGLEIGPGDEVITTPMTFCSTVQTILHVGASPVSPTLDPTAISIRSRSRSASLAAHGRSYQCTLQDCPAR